MQVALVWHVAMNSTHSATHAYNHINLGGVRHTVLLFCFAGLSLMRKTMRVWTKSCQLLAVLCWQHCWRSRWRTGHKLQWTNDLSLMLSPRSKHWRTFPCRAGHLLKLPRMCQPSHSRETTCMLSRVMSMMAMTQKSMSLSRKMWVCRLVFRPWLAKNETAIGSDRLRRL